MAENALRAVAFHLGYGDSFVKVRCVLPLMAGRYAISKEPSEASLGANTKGEPCMQRVPRMGYSMRRAGKYQGAGYHVRSSADLYCI